MPVELDEALRCPRCEGGWLHGCQLLDRCRRKHPAIECAARLACTQCNPAPAFHGAH